MEVLNTISWLYISWICDVFFRWLWRSIKEKTKDAVEEIQKESAEEEVVQAMVADEIKKIHKNILSSKRKCPYSKKTGSSSHYHHHKSSFFGDKTNLSDIHSEAVDKTHKKEESKVNEAENVSYYEDDGTFLFQDRKEKSSSSSPGKTKETPFVGIDSGKTFTTPEFYIKPLQVSDYNSKVVENEGHVDVINSDFKHLCDVVGSKFKPPNANIVNDDIHETFKEVYESLPTIFQ